MRFPPPLRISVPLTLFLLGLTLSLISMGIEISFTNKALEELIRRHVHFIGNQITGVASYFLARNDLAGLKQQVAHLGSDMGMQTALVCDPEGKVLTSSRFEYIGKALAETHLNAEQFKRNPRTATTTLSADGFTMIGVFPFLLPPRPGELIAQGEGFVLLEYDLSLPKGRTRKGLMERGILVVSVLAVVCSVLWWFFHKLLASRIERMVEGTRKIAAGNSSVTIDVQGSDEVAELARAFNEMASKVQTNTQELKEANARLQEELLQRETAQAALWASELRFGSVWENSKDAMRLTDENGMVIAANPAYLALTRMRAEEVTGKCFLDHYELKNDAKHLEVYRQRFRERNIELRKNRTMSFKGGNEVHLEIAYSFINIESEKPLLLGIFRDVTERVRSLEELKKAKLFSENLISTANVFIIGLTREGRVQIFNRTAEQILGWTKEEALGRHWFTTFIPPHEQERMNLLFKEVKEGGHRQVENVVVTKTGEERVISWQNNEILQDGEVAGTLSFGIDITEQRREEAKNRELERKLLEAQKLESLGILAGGIAHDFNNLLTAILGNANLASMQLTEESPIKPLLITIEKTSLRAAELCKQMLAYAGKGRMTISVFDLNTMVRETAELLNISISKKAQLRFTLDENIPPIKGDETQIRQIMMNLVINASEALEGKDGAIMIQTGTMEAGPTDFLKAYGAVEDLPPGLYVYMEIADNGGGMSAETQQKIFDPFFTTKFTGRGLGLAAVLGIVRSHRGALQLFSAPGQGSIFRVLFPAVAKNMLAPKVTALIDNQWHGSGTILVVDDDPQVRDLTTRILRFYGFEVLQASDGAEGVSVYRENSSRIIAVLMDMTMPRLSGREAFVQIRKIRPNAKVLLMSGYSEPVPESSFEGDGWSGFLQKPFKPDEIGAKLKSMLGI